MGKCRNFLFSAVFLGSYFAGNLIGIFLFQSSLQEHASWLSLYGAALLEAPFCYWGFWLALVRPLVLLWAVSFLPWGDQLLPALIGIRGMLNGYFCCSCYAAEIPSAASFLCLISLPAYFLLCRWIFRKTKTIDDRQVL